MAGELEMIEKDPRTLNGILIETEDFHRPVMRTDRRPRPAGAGRVE